MILLVQNDTEYENDLREMISAFFLGEKIKISTPSEVASFGEECESSYGREGACNLLSLYIWRL